MRRQQTPDGPPAASYLLKVLSGPDQGMSAVVEGPFLVGSHPEAGLVLSDSTVSRRHLEIELRPEGAVVRDLGSLNGTFLQGTQLKEFVVQREAVFSAGQTMLSLSVSEQVLPRANLAGTFGRSLARSGSMRRVFALLKQVASSDSTIVLNGETGTGKEALAHAVHETSPRRKKPYVVFDCGAVAASLVESELFGHAKGSFTGAAGTRDGVLLQADGGTLFLDEVGELPLDLQPRLLRFLETGTVKRVGDDRARAVDVRVVAATHRDLEAEVKTGRFRSDLYFRLAVVTVRVPPLRERPEDIPLLVSHFVTELGCPAFTLSDELMTKLSKHAWPGNVRELRNVIERALASGGVKLDSLPLPPQGRPSAEDLAQMPFKAAKDAIVDVFMREYFESLFEQSGRSVSEMARRAGIARTYAHRLVKKLGLKED